MPAIDHDNGTSKHVEMSAFEKLDPLLRLLTYLVGTRSVWYSVVIAVVLTAPVYIVGAREGVFVNPQLKPDLASDIGNYVMFFATSPFLMVVSVLYFRRYVDTIRVLETNGALHAGDQGFRRCIESWNKRVGSWWMTTAIYCGALFVCVLSEETFTFSRPNSWHWPDGLSHPSFASLLEWPALFLVNYLIAQLVLRVILSFWFIRSLFRNSNLIVQPLHPDRCGGLGPIGTLAMFLNAVVFVTGLMVAGGLYSNIYITDVGVLAPVNFLIVLAYLGMSAAVVFTPIWAAHKKMEEERDTILGQLNRKFDRINRRLTQSMVDDSDPDITVLKQQQESLTTIRDLYSLVDQHPVWPFNAKVMYSFAGSVLWPVVFFLIQIYLTRFLD